jgi:LDH2 family malate/lactate/ureidoglycolate dehydrogenase
LLWFDTAGAASFGIASLPGLLERIASGAIDPAAGGVVVAERSATAVFDGRKGVPLLALDRAAGIATEKARETGVGLVRVENLDAPGPAAGVAAEMAVGPFVGLVVGPGPSWALALPAEGGLPAVFDPSLSGAPAAPPWQDLAGPWSRVLAPGPGCLVAALAVTAMEALTTFHERLADALRGLEEAGGRLLPAPWEARRRAAQQHGLGVDPAAWAALREWSARLAVAPPPPLPA